MDQIFLKERTLRNAKRRKLLQKREIDAFHENDGIGLSKVLLRQNNGELSYEIFFGDTRGSKMLSLNEAMDLLPTPLLLFLGVDDGAVVNNEVANSLGLLYCGEEESSQTWGVLRNTNGKEREHWVPTNVRKNTKGIYYARDRRTDGPHEWHDDILMWSLSGLNEEVWSAAVEALCVYGDDGDPTPEIMDLRSKIQWLHDVHNWCSYNIGQSYNIESGVGCRDLSECIPPSGFAQPPLVMSFYSPQCGCLVAAAAALIKEPDEDSAALLIK